MNKKYSERDSDEVELLKKLGIIKEHNHYPYLTLEIHPDGVKEVSDECPFCEKPCNEPHCPYTEKE